MSQKCSLRVIGITIKDPSIFPPPGSAALAIIRNGLAHGARSKGWL